jgi:hypothetical protein
VKVRATARSIEPKIPAPSSEVGLDFDVCRLMAALPALPRVAYAPSVCCQVLRHLVGALALLFEVVRMADKYN